MKKVSAYIILYEETASALEREVNKKLAEEFVLRGYMVISSGWFYQPMVKYEVIPFDL